MKKQSDQGKSNAIEKKGPAPGRVTIRPLPSGVRGLDDILGGGIPEFSFNIIAGTPGCGKTTLAHQFVFANATEEKPALYFTLLGEPTIKMLRYQQQFSFFDLSKLGKAIQFINLADLVLEQDLNSVFDEITKRVAAVNPRFVIVDSFRTVERKVVPTSRQIEMQSFTQRLAQFLTGWEATTFLVGEYVQDELRDNPVFTVADGIYWLSQVADRNSVVRKLQILKLRGQGSVPGLHTIRINQDGLQAFSRTLGLLGEPAKAVKKRHLSTGIAELDAMMGGGVLQGDSLIVAGPSGTGKSVLAKHFIAEGLRHGEPGIMAIFEERPQGYIERADSLGLDFKKWQDAGKLELLYLRPLDLTVDEAMQAILDAIARTGAKRLTLDSLAGFEAALAPAFPADFRESLYRLIWGLTRAGVTILSTVEVEDTFTGLPFSHYAISFLTDDIIRMRYVEIEGQLRKVLVVIKMRGGNHSKDIREYLISDEGELTILPRSKEYSKLTTGTPELTSPKPVLPNGTLAPTNAKASKKKK